MRRLFLGSIYLMFFLSGAAALIYQVVWVRALTLIFGGSHLAVTAVLSIFMAGLAIGGYAIGKWVDRVKKPLRLYGLLELGIALFALIFMGLMKLYPSLYVPLAQGKDNASLYLFLIRILFSVTALIIPTTLMGGTLPVLSRFVSKQPQTLRTYLSFLYGINTFGAVLGAIAGGFFFLRLLGVSSTLQIAILTNVFIGLAALLLQGRAATVLTSDPPVPKEKNGVSQIESKNLPYAEKIRSVVPLKLVLWGIGISGFCALGYEVLWARILTIVVGASVYSFTTMLVAFLAGIAMGSEAYGLLPGLFKIKDKGTNKSILWFGGVQIIIGVTALLVTIYLRDIPANSIRVQNYFLGMGLGSFGVRVWSNFALAFFYMVIPAFFMGVAFPLAGKIYAEYRKIVGSAVGEILAYNTVGAILGASISGYVMIYLFGIERSLQMLTVVNIGFGLLVFFSVRKISIVNWGVACLTAAALLFLGLNQNALRIWDMKYFAIFRNNQPEAFRTPEMVREAVENTDVLYYGEGVEAIVSAIKIKGGEQSFITNGRIEASSHLQALQCQFTLGHLPMLLNKNPRNVLVVGLGSGMTLGATSVHPSVEQMTLLEIEPKVMGVAKTFEKYNHHVLDNPKLRVIFNDGRNFLMTTKAKFDVITADPIHPWFRGAGYLYTSEYFKLASEHLLPGGVICQWLPIYEMTPEDLKSVVRTFQEHFKHTMLWLTHYDAELVGSNSPFLIDEAELERRIAEPAILSDLSQVMMGSATDLLSYFVMGEEGMKRFSQGGIVNTDDNLYLEFSAPFSIATPSVMEANVRAIVRERESILPYLRIPNGKKAQEDQKRMWANHPQAVEMTGRALALFLGGRRNTLEFEKSMEELDKQFPRFAPARFLRNEYQALLSMNPRLLERVAFNLENKSGARTVTEISAVLVPVSKERASVMFVDNRARVIYGQLYVSDYNQNDFVSGFVNQVMIRLRAIYQKEAENALRRGATLPLAEPTLEKIKEGVVSEVAKASLKDPVRTPLGRGG
ncbi:MAG TPA: fused MFS/spermidine synthase, partial [Thermodesulfobacteriota bacterium]|nr:fused MFS/spermidine synthase [Thermodesulfobacteriota bacterium]